jgi:hypothetical protein
MILVFALLAGLIALPAPHATDAQDGMITCDSTLITLLFIAENDYGFHSMMDVSTIDKGQFAPAFEAMMAMMDDEMMDEEMADEEMMDEEMADEEMMDEEMAEEEMMDDMMMLAPGVVAGEAAECTALREEVEAYLYKAISDEMMMMDEG